MNDRRSPPRTALLDVDGTLVNSNDFHACAWSEAARECGFDRAVEFFQPLIGMGGDRVLPKISSELSPEGGLGREIAKRRDAIFEAKYLRSVRPTRGARRLVEFLFEYRVKCVVASSASAKELDALLDIVGVRGYIAASTTSDDAESTKPAPDIVAAALRKASVSPDEAVLIGDTPYDIESGAGAGVRVIALRSGGWGTPRLAGAIEIYDDPADLLARIRQSPTFMGLDEADHVRGKAIS